MDERQEQNLQEIDRSLETTIEWMRKRQPGDWAKVQVPGEPHRYGTMHLYLLLRIESLLSEMNERQIEQDKLQIDALTEYKKLLQEQRLEKHTSRRKPKEQAE